MKMTIALEIDVTQVASADGVVMDDAELSQHASVMMHVLVPKIFDDGPDGLISWGRTRVRLQLLSVDGQPQLQLGPRPPRNPWEDLHSRAWHVITDTRSTPEQKEVAEEQLKLAEKHLPRRDPPSS
jgi:hypothetical protein